jgi:prepilin-type N-terminal cleavage/methylation domain-containing protein
MNRKGLTLVELLAVIVILAILMVSAGAAIMSTLNNARVNTFKNEALSAISIADNMYTEISMNPTDARNYLKNSSDSNYKGMCVTLNGLVLNGYLNKELDDGKALRGVILIEVPFDGGATKRSIWITNGTYAISGYEEGMINSLRYKKSNNGVISSTSAYYELENSGVVTDISKADLVIDIAHGNKDINGAAITGADGLSSTSSSNVKTTIYSPYKQGGTVDEKNSTDAAKKPNYYADITCINASLNKS